MKDKLSGMNGGRKSPTRIDEVGRRRQLAELATMSFDLFRERFLLGLVFVR